MNRNLLFAIVLFSVPLSVSAVPSDDPVLDAKIHVAALEGRGLGAKHPAMQEAQARVDASSVTTPAVPPEDYLIHVQNRLKETEQEEIVFSKEGLAEHHPKRMIVAAKLRFLRQELQRLAH